MFKVTMNEIRDLIIAFIFISLSFAIASSGRDPSVALSILPYILVGSGAGFIFHELGHKFTSMKYNYWAEFKLWPQGLLTALVISIFFGFVFAAPGAVYVYGNPDEEINGKISVAGPITNIVLALIFLAIGTSVYTSAFSSDFFVTVFIICAYGFSVNSNLAVFNMLPIGILDGSKVLRWNVAIWIAVIAIAGILTLGTHTIGFENIVRLIIGI